MVDLFCAPFVDLIDRIRFEYRNQGSIFDLPEKKWYLPAQDDDAPDLSVRFHGRLAGNAVGPASGPQTQMAQNLVLSWLAGSRIMELKTVQIDDRLNIPRPCIDATNVGYNVEWSQELLVAESLDQYVQGAMLIHMLRQAPEEFGHPFGDVDFSGPLGETIYDMSIGYDLAGIKSPKVCEFIRGMIDARDSVAERRELIPNRLGRLRDLDYPIELSKSITLSTFHGCPAGEIERICEFLLTELDVDVIVKMNPPMLGKESLENLLYEVMGYHELKVNEQAYSSGLQFDESIEICGRLMRLAASKGLKFGAKFSNTLEVVNHRDFFTPDNEIMYLSGAPLHVITLTLAEKFREAMGPEIPISFSAGVDRRNFPNLVACGFVPVTTCTDLLKTGGYGRLPPYLKELEKEMKNVGARTVDDFILDARGQREAAGGDPVRAGFLNSPIIVQETQADERYRQPRNNSIPRRIESHLVTFDCITCDKCIPVCPNDANFAYKTPQIELTYRDLLVGPDGSVSETGAERLFKVERSEQIANFADFCNHCGNCDTFCPEYDGPYLEKPSFFGSRAAYDAGAKFDGFLLEGAPDRLTLVGRIKGSPCRLEQRAGEGEYSYSDGTVQIIYREGRPAQLDSDLPRPSSPHTVEMGRFHTMLTLLRGITDSSHVHQVNASLQAAAEPGLD